MHPAAMTAVLVALNFENKFVLGNVSMYIYEI